MHSSMLRWRVLLWASCKAENMKKAVQFPSQDKQRMDKVFENMTVGIKVMFNCMVKLR